MFREDCKFKPYDLNFMEKLRKYKLVLGKPSEDKVKDQKREPHFYSEDL